jgi:type I restriction enzyme, S subunit
MTLPRYPAYKDSGVEWLGEVPEHWREIALSRILDCPVTDGPHTTPEFVDSGVPFLSVDAIQDGRLVFDGCRFVSELDHQEFSRKAAPRRNDILMGKAASVGKIARVEVDFSFSIWSPLALIRADISRCNPSFLEYALKSPYLQNQIVAKSNANTQLNIGMKDIPKLRMCLPSMEEQTAIASFLGHETAKIDVLISEQSKLIDLLKEKRQAVISHAVTKGLNPDVPLKDSGVEWFGEVPEHWREIALSRILDCPVTDGPHTTPEFVDSGVPFLSVDAIQDGRLVFDGCRFVSELDHQEFSRKAAPRRNDILMGKAASVGKIARVEVDFSFSIWSPLALIRADISRCNPSFLEYALKSPYLQNQIVAKSNANTQLNIGMKDIPKLRMCLPSMEEQTAIASFLGHETAKIDVLITEGEHAIDLLQERRSALISAAVTGKIDVRNRVASEAA